MVPTDGGRIMHYTRHVSNDEVVTETESYSKVMMSAIQFFLGMISANFIDRRSGSLSSKS